MAGLAELETALSKIKAGKVPPVVLVYGDQGYLVKQAYDRLLDAIVPEELRSFNLEQLDGSKAEAGSVLSAFEIMPMMAGAKAVGVQDARFFQSKSNGAEIISRSREAWEKQDINGSLRHLARVLALIGWSWADAAGKSAADFASALENDEVNENTHGGDWLVKALAQGHSSDFHLPAHGDEAGELLAGLESILATPDEGFVRSLVFSASSADGRKKIYKFIQEKGLVLDFKTEKKGPQASQTASVFLRNLLTQRGLSMQGSTGQRFVSAYGFDLGLLVKELDKLENYAHPRKELTDADLSAVGSPQPEDSIFELLAALGKKQKGLGEALPLLMRLCEREAPQMIFSMLANEVRLLHLCRVLLDEGRIPARGSGDYFSYKSSVQPQLASSLPAGLGASFKKLHPFVTFQALTRAKQFEAKDLRAMLKSLLDADLRLKSGGSNARRELEELCLRLAGIEEETYV